MRYVVAGAVLRERGGTTELLLAQRSYPEAVAGLWELPGGKAEDGEDLADALRRELLEELEITVEVGAGLAERVVLRDDLTMLARWARILRGTPHAVEHRGLRWVGPDDLERMARTGELVPADEVWVPELAAVLRDD
ncbi:NUDIX domain-containing protein [Gordonia caeni]|uniref:8-oxo-dGTP diphosphatase n=1 Tax=Gordonia caeni TaxID=1007097 RepID=A0ABP7P0N6_9ACTN